jgi:hypothetical protein
MRCQLCCLCQVVAGDARVMCPSPLCGQWAALATRSSQGARAQPARTVMHVPNLRATQRQAKATGRAVGPGRGGLAERRARGHAKAAPPSSLQGNGERGGGGGAAQSQPSVEMGLQFPLSCAPGTPAARQQPRPRDGTPALSRARARPPSCRPSETSSWPAAPPPPLPPPPPPPPRRPPPRRRTRPCPRSRRRPRPPRPPRPRPPPPPPPSSSAGDGVMVAARADGAGVGAAQGWLAAAATRGGSRAAPHGGRGESPGCNSLAAWRLVHTTRTAPAPWPRPRAVASRASEPRGRAGPRGAHPLRAGGGLLGGGLALGRRAAAAAARGAALLGGRLGLGLALGRLLGRGGLGQAVAHLALLAPQRRGWDGSGRGLVERGRFNEARGRGHSPGRAAGQGLLQPSRGPSDAARSKGPTRRAAARPAAGTRRAGRLAPPWRQRWASRRAAAGDRPAAAAPARPLAQCLCRHPVQNLARSAPAAPPLIGAPCRPP